jgi:hypothetical protein
MALAIRGAIDAIPVQMIGFSDPDLDHLAHELSLLFTPTPRSDV